MFNIDKGPCCQNPVQSSDFISDLMEDINPAWTPGITHLYQKYTAYLLEKTNHKMLKTQFSGHPK